MGTSPLPGLPLLHAGELGGVGRLVGLDEGAQGVVADGEGVEQAQCAQGRKQFDEVSLGGGARFC